jgi:hypothetical protein
MSGHEDISLAVAALGLVAGTRLTRTTGSPSPDGCFNINSPRQGTAALARAAPNSALSQISNGAGEIMTQSAQKSAAAAWTIGRAHPPLSARLPLLLEPSKRGPTNSTPPPGARIFGEAARLGVLQVHLFGGEPARGATSSRSLQRRVRLAFTPTDHFSRRAHSEDARGAVEGGPRPRPDLDPGQRCSLRRPNSRL